MLFCRKRETDVILRSMMIATAIILLPVCSSAQKKEIKEARTYIKKGNNLDKAEQLMTNLIKKDSANQNNPKIYRTWFLAVEKQYEQGNEKLYLKQKYDTATLFNNALRMFPILLHLDSIDTEHKYRKTNASDLNKYRPNIYFGGTFFTKKQDYGRAFEFFDTYLNTTVQPLFTQYDYSTTDTLLAEAAYWATFCGFKEKNHEHTLKYAEQALADSLKRPFVLQYVSEAYLGKNDTTNYIATLRKGSRQYPSFPFFYPRLIDYYNEEELPDSVIALADEALSIDSTSTLFLYAKSTALLNLGKNDECIVISDSIIHQNDTLPDPYFNAGTAWLNKALKMEKGKEKRSRIRQCYKHAKPYMERYRELRPDEKGKWAPALYRIYLNLNMGKKFEEIDNLL